MAVQTSKNLAKTQKETAERELEAQVKQAAKALEAEKLLKVSIPKALEKHVGPTVPFGINGVMIVLPVDGKEYEVPAPFKALVQDFLENLQA